MAGLGGEDGAVVGQHAGRIPVVGCASWKVVTTSRALVTRRAIEATHSREWSSMMFKTSTSVPVASATWVTSICQRRNRNAHDQRLREIVKRANVA
jgi:hypothetical protein